MSDLDYNAAAARSRQQRLLAEMQTLRLDLVIVQTIEHVQWLTGARYPWTMSPAAALRADGRLTLQIPLEADNAATRSNDGRVHPCGALWIGTMGRKAEKGAGAAWTS